MWIDDDELRKPIKAKNCLFVTDSLVLLGLNFFAKSKHFLFIFEVFIFYQDRNGTVRIIKNSKICYNFCQIYIFDTKLSSESQCFKMEVYIFYRLLANSPHFLSVRNHI